VDRKHGKRIESDVNKFPGYAQNKKFTCPIDKSDKEHKHKHSSNSNLYTHIELFDYCSVQIYFERRRDREGVKYDAVSGILVSAMGTEVALPVNNAKRIGHRIEEMLASMA
jgi:hypothetical protein